MNNVTFVVYATVLLITLVARTCEAFGTAGFEEFCFDDSQGISATGLRTCAQVVAQGHCRTESYSKFCHRTCKMCTDGVSMQPLGTMQFGIMSFSTSLSNTTMTWCTCHCPKRVQLCTAMGAIHTF